MYVPYAWNSRESAHDAPSNVRRVPFMSNTRCNACGAALGDVFARNRGAVHVRRALTDASTRRCIVDASAVVVARLQDDDVVTVDQVHEPVLLVDAT